MKTNKFSFIIVLSIFFLLSPSLAKAIPTDMSVAESVASGDWSNPSTWSNGVVPDDSTFVTIRPGHTVTLTTNSFCVGLVIDANATLDNGIYELRIQLRGFMQGIQWNDFDDGIPYGLSGNAPPIDATWDITNPNNVNWSIYMVNGTHAGTGDIKISFFDVYDGGTSSPASSPITITGNGTITNTGTLYPIDGGTRHFKFNSACNVDFYCDINIFSYQTSGGTLHTSGISHNYGHIKLKGNANIVAGGTQNTFINKPNASVTIDNGNLSLCDPASYLGIFFNYGLINILNGDLYIPSTSVFLNHGVIKVNGSIYGFNTTQPEQSNFTQQAIGATLSFTGELFPATNKGILSTKGDGQSGPVRPNYVIYNGVNQNVAVPHTIYSPPTTATEEAYSVVIFANSGTKTLLGNIGVNDSLVIKDNAIFTTSASSYAIEMNNAAVWKNTGLDSDPFLENNGLVSFVGDSSLMHHILCDVTGGETFYDLTINNSGAGVLLNLTDVNVSDTLRLEDGVVTTNTNKLYLTNPSAGSLASFSDTSFINGNLRREIATNTDTYSFPVGHNTLATTYYQTDLLNNSLVGINYIDAHVNPITETGNNVDSQLTADQGGNLVGNVINEAIWNLTPNTQPTAGDYGVQLYTQNITGLTDNLFFTVKRPNTSVDYADWNTYSSTTTVPALNTNGRTISSGYAQRNGLTTFSEFAIGTVSDLTAGIDKNALSDAISIYPNPASSFINIDLGNLANGNIVVELRDLQGKRITTGTLIGNNLFQIRRNNIANGMYLLNVIIGNERYAKKILFQ